MSESIFELNKNSYVNYFAYFITGILDFNRLSRLNGPATEAVLVFRTK